MSAPREGCIAGAYGQSWPCRMAWLVAFGSGSLVELEWLDEVVACSPTGQAAAVPVGLPVSDLNPEASLTTGPLIAECYVLGSAGVYPELVRYE